MKKKDVQINRTYEAKVSGKLTEVKILNESRFGGWDAKNIHTGRMIRIKTAAKLRKEVS
jgi:hypothetical protein